MLLCDTNYCHHSLSHIVHYIHMYITTEESGKEWLTIHVSVDSVLHHTIVVERVCTRSPWACSIDTSITVTLFDFGIFLHSKWAVKYNTGIDLFGGIISGFCIYWYSTVMTNEEKISSVVHFALFQLLRKQRFESLFFPTLKLFIKMHFLYETCHNMFFYYQTYSSTPSFHPFQMSLYIFTRFSCIDNVYSFSRYK